jgi:hypothetical protein
MLLLNHPQHPDLILVTRDKTKTWNLSFILITHKQPVLKHKPLRNNMCPRNEGRKEERKKGRKEGRKKKRKKERKKEERKQGRENGRKEAMKERSKGRKSSKKLDTNPQ